MIDQNTLAPIVLFVYNRPWHTQQTLEALSKNELSSESVLYIFADGSKENALPETLQQIKETREIIKSKKWCKEVIISEKEKNMGLADSIISGVTEIINKCGKIIVLEDDIVTSKGFLKYMNEALEIYSKENQVMQISGFMFPINSFGLPNTFFYNANSCWGWATWKRAWEYFENDPQKLYLKLIKKQADWTVFNALQGNAFREQLLLNIENKITTWAVKWHSVIYLCNGLVLHPKKSLTKNIGFDSSGVHCDTNTVYINMKMAKSIRVKKIKIHFEHKRALKRLKKYFQNIDKPNSLFYFKNLLSRYLPNNIKKCIKIFC